MKDIGLGALPHVDPREVWPHEAHDFTPWLAEHLVALGDVIGIELELSSREAAVGDFSLDLLARDLGRDCPVIIENQLEATNHDHLGKLLTYAAGYDAGVVIWIAKEFREEHRQAIDWLNGNTGPDVHFFAVVLEVLKIDESRPAVNFKLVAFPNEWRKANVSESAGPKSERGERYRVFFQGLIDQLREKHRFTGARVGQPQNWYSFSSGIAGVRYGASFSGDKRIRVDLYIDDGEVATTKALFDGLYAHRSQIESEAGEELTWERLDDKRASRVCFYREGSVDDEADKLTEITAWAIQRLLGLKRVFPGWIERIRDAQVQEVGVAAAAGSRPR